MERDDLDGLLQDVALARSPQLRKTYRRIALWLLPFVPVGLVIGFGSIDYCGSSKGSPAPCVVGFGMFALAGSFSLAFFLAAAKGTINSYYLREAGLENDRVPAEESGHSWEDEKDDVPSKPEVRIEQLQLDGTWDLLCMASQNSYQVRYPEMKALAERTKSVLRAVWPNGYVGPAIDGTK